MNPTLIQFSSNPLFFQFFGHLIVGLFSCWILLRKRPVPDIVFLLTAVLLTAFMRLPVFLFNHELDPDESQMLTQGLTLSIDPIIYRSVDPTTGGPLTSYLLAGIAKLGFTLDFHLAHVLSWFLTMAALLMGYYTAKLLHLASTVQWALLPFISFLSFIQFTDFVIFYSEITSILFLNACVLLLAYWGQKQAFRAGELVLFGFMLGVIPLCKLQALPMAFIIGIFACIQLFVHQRPQALRHFAFLAIGFLGWWIVWCLFLWKNQVLNDFFTYYIKANLEYNDSLSVSGVSRSKFVNFFRLPWVIIRKGCGFEWLLYPFIFLTSAGIYLSIIRKKLGKIIALNSYFWIMLGGYLLMANLAITRTGSFYEHYFHYLFLPFLLFFNLCLKYFSAQSRWVMLFTQLAFLIILANNSIHGRPTNRYTSTPQEKDVTRAQIAQSILKYGHPGQYLAVWGWSCDLYVVTQMPQGVNENHTTRSGMKHSLQEQYYKRYLSDMKRTGPAIFVDAITSNTLWMDNPKKYGHQNYPELAQFIAENYTLKEEIKGVKIYALKHN